MRVMRPTDIFFVCCFVIIGICLIFLLIRAILGPRFTDRIVCANLASTKVVASGILLSVFLNEKFLLDVSLTYALLGFLAVLVLGKMFAARLMVTPKGGKSITGTENTETKEENKEEE